MQSGENSAPVQRETGRVRKKIRWLAISIGGFFAILIAVVMVTVTFGIPIDISGLRGRIEAAASEALGRELAIEGPITLVPTMPPAVQIEGVRVGNPQAWGEGDFARLNLARARLRVIPLLSGEVLINEITVEELHVNLETNAEGKPNWLLTKPKEKPKRDEPERERATRFVELVELSMRDITVTHRNATTGKVLEFQLKDISGSAKHREPMQLLIHGAIQQVPYEMEFKGGSLGALIDGKEPWPLDIGLTLAGLKFIVAGEIAEPLRGKGISLDFSLSGSMTGEAERVLGTQLPPISSIDLRGRIEEAAGRYRITNVQGKIETNEITGDFEVDVSGLRPRVHGSIGVRSIDATPFFAGVHDEQTVQDELEKQSKQSLEEPTDGGMKESSKAVAVLDLGEPVLTLEPLEKFDAHFRVTVQEIVNAPATVQDVTLEVSVENGSLMAPLTATIAEVPFRGKLILAPENDEPTAAITLTADKSDIGELAQLLMKAEGIEGRFKSAELQLSARGDTIRSLVETAELRFAIAGASLSYGQKSGSRPVEFTLDKGEMVFPSAGQSRVYAKGSLLDEPFSMELNGGTFIENRIKRIWPVELTATGGGAELRIKGTVRPTESNTGNDLRFSLTGKRIGGLARWVGVSSEAKEPYKLSGKATVTKKGIRFGIDKAQVGNSVFAGEMGIRRENDKTVTFARLDFEAIDPKGLAGLLSQSPETEKPEEGKTAFSIDVPIMPQDIEIFDSDINIRIGRIKLKPADITQLALSTRIRDGYVKESPIQALIAGSRFAGTFTADLRGEVPKVDLDVKSHKVDVGALLVQLGLAKGLEMTVGRFHLEFAMRGASARQILEQSEFSADIEDGLWKIHAPNTQGTLDIRIPKGVIRARRGEPIALNLDGQIDTTPVKAEIETESLASFAKSKDHLRMDINIALAETKLKLTGTAPLPLQAQSLHFQMDLTGKQFSDFDELLEVSLPPLGPYQLAGEFGSREAGYYIENLQFKVGESALTGELKLKTTETPPRLTVDLKAKSIQLDDFDTGDWSAVGTAEQTTDKQTVSQEAGETKKGSIKGHALFSPEVMRSLDGKFTVNVTEVFSGQDRLGDGTLMGNLKKGRLSIDALKLNIPGGAVDAAFALESTNSDVGLEVKAKIEQLDYGILARRIDPKSGVGGLISVDVDLETRGPKLASIMYHSNGHIDFAVWPKDLNAGIFDIWAINLFVALMPSLDSGAGSKVNCVVGRFDVNGGVMHPAALLIDSSRIQASGEGTINFQTNTIDFITKPRPKLPQMFSAQTPIQVKGRFSDFKVGVPPGALVGTAFRMITSPVVVPFKWVLTKKAPPDGKVACEQAWSRQPPP